MKKAVPFMLIGVCLVSSVAFCSTRESVQGEDITVEAEVLKSAAIIGQDSSAAVTLGATPGVIVNSQGVGGGQADLSIRGSSFSGAGISLAGLALPSPETEHFNSELPLDVAMLSSPEVLTGFEQMLLTEGHLIGTASFDILPVVTGHRLTLGISEDNGYWINLLVQQSMAVTNGAFAGAGAFGSHTEINEVDNQHNDLTSSRGGGQLQLIQGEGCKSGLVFNPAAPLDALEYVMDKVDLIMLMSVNPGFGGQSFIPSTMTKLKQVRKMIDDSGYDIRLEVDGGVKANNIKEIKEAGADMFVAGSAIFGAHNADDPNHYDSIITEFRSELAKANV